MQLGENVSFAPVSHVIRVLAPPLLVIALGLRLLSPCLAARREALRRPRRPPLRPGRNATAWPLCHAYSLVATATTVLTVVSARPAVASEDDAPDDGAFLPGGANGSAEPALEGEDPT